MIARPFLLRVASRRKILEVGLAVLLLALCAGATILRADAAPAPAGAPTHEDFGQYLVDHQAELGPFFEKNSGVLIGQAVPLLLAWIGRIMFLTLLIGWVVDALLGRGFSMLFAPAWTRINRALVYATGRLVLSVVLTILLGVIVTLVSGASHFTVILAVVVGLFVLVAAAAQVGWIHYLYKTDLFISFLFCLTLAVIHSFIALAVSVPTMGGHAGQSALTFMDQFVTPKLDDEVKATRQELAAATPGRDEAAGEVTRLRDGIAQAQADQVRFKQEIDEKKSSPGYLFSQIVKVHAQGDLTAARDQFTAFLVQFPSGPLTGLAKGQLVQVQSELAAQELQKNQNQAAAARSAAQARADLLARAARGEATLSEMRNALIGRSRQEVSALLGPPSETASDRWGFAQEMIVNPLTNQKSGLAVYFLEGDVQGVDYYFGTGGAR